MDQIGYVTNLEGDMAKVVVRRASACGDKCSSCGGACNVPSVIVNIKNTIDVKPGDYVEVRVKTQEILKSAFLVYMTPLFMLILGIVAGVYYFKSMLLDNYEIYGILTGIVFLLISFVILRLIDNKAKSNNNISFEMVRVIND